MSASDSTTTAADKTRTARRIRRRAVVQKFHVDEDVFATEAEANLWADSLHRGENHVAKTRPELTDARSKSLARATAEALFDYAKELGVDAAESADDSDRPAHDPMPVAHTNGSGHSAGSAQA